VPAPAPRHGASPPVGSSSPRPGSGHATESTDGGAAHGDTPGRRSSGASPHGGSSRTTVRTRCMAASLPHRPPRHEDGTSAWTGHRDGCVGDVATAGRTSVTEAASGWITSPPPHQGESAWAHAPGWITSPPPGGWTGTAVNMRHRASLARTLMMWGARVRSLRQSARCSRSRWPRVWRGLWWR